MLEPGECFGHPSLLTGMAPAFTVRAREPSSVRAARARGDARRVLGTEAGVAYVATTMRERLTRTGQTVHGLPDVGTTPGLGDHAPADVRDADDAVREGLEQLERPGVTALLVAAMAPTPVRRLAIVTDAEVRAARRRRAATLETPLRAIARAPVADRPRRPARDRGDGRHARRRRRAPGGARRRAGVRVAVGRATCSGSTRAARSRCATRSSARPTRTRARARRRAPAAAVRCCCSRAGVPAARPRAGAEPSARRGRHRG